MNADKIKWYHEYQKELKSLGVDYEIFYGDDELKFYDNRAEGIEATEEVWSSYVDGELYSNYQSFNDILDEMYTLKYKASQNAELGERVDKEMENFLRTYPEASKKTKDLMKKAMVHIKKYIFDVTAK